MVEGSMRRGYILVKLGKTTGGLAAQAAEAAREFPGVERVELVTGPFDLILHVGAAGRPSGPDLLARVRAVSGVLRALPCWASAESGSAPPAA